LKKEQIGPVVPFLSGWGHRKGGLRGGVGVREVQKSYVPIEINFLAPPDWMVEISFQLYILGLQRAPSAYTL